MLVGNRAWCSPWAPQLGTGLLDDLLGIAGENSVPEESCRTPEGSANCRSQHSVGRSSPTGRIDRVGKVQAQGSAHEFKGFQRAAWSVHLLPAFLS